MGYCIITTVLRTPIISIFLPAHTENRKQKKIASFVLLLLSSIHLHNKSCSFRRKNCVKVLIAILYPDSSSPVKSGHDVDVGRGQGQGQGQRKDLI